MGLRTLWDTNVAIYYLKKDLEADKALILDQLSIDSSTLISIISEIELLCWKTEAADDLISLKTFVSRSIVLPLDQQVKQKTIDIRRTSRLKLPDAIIAATAIVHNLTLVTRNSKDFELVPNLALLNPWAVQL